MKYLILIPSAILGIAALTVGLKGKAGNIARALEKLRIWPTDLGSFSITGGQLRGFVELTLENPTHESGAVNIDKIYLQDGSEVLGEGTPVPRKVELTAQGKSEVKVNFAIPLTGLLSQLLGGSSNLEGKSLKIIFNVGGIEIPYDVELKTSI